MNRDEFNKLSIENQVKYFNKQIKELGTSSAASRHLGYKDESTIRKRFRSKGYKLNDSKTEYILFNKGEIPVINKSNTYVINNSETHVTNKATKKSHAEQALIKEDDIKEIKELLKIKDTLFKIADLYKDNKIAPKNRIEINTERFKDEKAVTKGLKVYPTILNEFKDFCRSHREYKMQDMFSMAMIEYMENHK